jgi:hypothetical protein
MRAGPPAGNAIPQPTVPKPVPHPITSTRRIALLASILATLALPAGLLGQGCVIARGGGAAAILDGSGFLEKGDWQANLAFRHFLSHRHFAGSVEQKHREINDTEVENDSFFYDFTLTYAWSKRLSLNLTIPFVHHDRSSLYEHLGNNSGQRFHTQAAGLADVRASFNYWLIDPAKESRGNLSIGAGIKFATGNDEVRDIFVRPSGPTERYVDSSIQPGDGGVGFSVELQGFYHIGGPWTAYGNAFYLFNPEERNERTNFSIPDAYMARGGFDYSVASVQGLSLTLGARIEGVPGVDAFGGSRGSRRPGFATSIEPGVTFSKGRYSGALTVPVAVHRNRTTTYGQLTAGDAAFADYTINLSLSMKL